MGSALSLYLEKKIENARNKAVNKGMADYLFNNAEVKCLSLDENIVSLHPVYEISCRHFEKSSSQKEKAA